MRRMDHLLLTIILAGGLSFVVQRQAHAEGSGSMITGSGAVQEEQGPSAEDRIRAVASLRTKASPTRAILTASLEKREAFQTERRGAVQRIGAYLQDCHEELRRANRDEKLSTMLRCYRGRLMLDLTWLRKQRQWMLEDKSIGAEAQTQALDSTDALIDAIAAIVTGIDSNVYDGEAGLREAKTLLHSQYRLRQWIMVLHADADRLLSWTALVANDASDHVPADDDGMLPSWNAAAECLETQIAWLMQVKQATTYDDALAAWTSARSQAAACIPAIKTALKTVKNAGSGSVLP